MGKKKVRKELKKLRAELREVQRELRHTRAQLAAPAEPARAEPGPIEVPTACAPKSLLPKTECCGSKDRCTRCPILMLKQGTLPEGLTVKHRKLVDAQGKKVTKKSLTRAA